LRSTWAARGPGQPLFLKDLNCHCFDPSTTIVLNPNAWTDTLSGQFSPSAAYYNDFRYQRRPPELASLGCTFRVKERLTFQIRAEFNNILNRTLFRWPASRSRLELARVFRPPQMRFHLDLPDRC
jgi:hypothetical protein